MKTRVASLTAPFLGAVAALLYAGLPILARAYYIYGGPPHHHDGPCLACDCQNPMKQDRSKGSNLVLCTFAATTFAMLGEFWTIWLGTSLKFVRRRLPASVSVAIQLVSAVEEITKGESSIARSSATAAVAGVLAVVALPAGDGGGTAAWADSFNGEMHATISVI